MITTHPFIEKIDKQPYQTGVLSGLTFAVKDFIDVEHSITGCGNPTWHNTHARALHNAVCVDQLLSAGAQCMGKTHCDEFGFSLYGKNAFYGMPLNPCAPDRIPGGSSSGSASAVASKLADFALGTDTAGSVRVPANNCGLFGMRPSPHRGSLSGVVTCSPTFDTVGLFARSMDIIEKVATILYALPKHTTPFFQNIYILEDVFAMADECVQNALKFPLAHLEKKFPAHIQRTSLTEIIGIPDGLKSCFETHSYIKNIEAWNSFSQWMLQHDFPLSLKIKENFAYIASLDRTFLAEKMIIRAYIRQKLNAFLGTQHIFCFPTAAGLPPLISTTPQELKDSLYARRTLSIGSIACIGALPEITVPYCEIEEAPIGLSFAAAHGQERFLIQTIQSLS